MLPTTNSDQSTPSAFYPAPGFWAKLSKAAKQNRMDTAPGSMLSRGIVRYTLWQS